MVPTFFPTQAEFRTWFEKNHKVSTELIVGFYKVDSGKPSMTWPQSVDEALCFGWIDGIRKSIDKDSYCIRFTPRKKTSIWSAVNINKVEVLIGKGLMQAAGMEAYSHRRDDKSGIYSFENEEKQLSDELEKIFRGSKPGWDFFTSQPPGYRKMIIHWIMSAKRAETRLSRLEKAVLESEKNARIKFM